MRSNVYAAEVLQQATKTPNLLTLSRVPLAILVIGLGIYDLNWLAVGCVFAAAVTDGLDGYLARRWQQETPLGRVGDPLADKFFVDFSLLAAGVLLEDWLLLTLWLVTVLYDLDNTWQRRREIARALLNLPSDRADLPATLMSKTKTAMLFLLIGYAYLPPEWVSESLLSTLALLSLFAVTSSWWNN